MTDTIANSHLMLLLVVAFMAFGYVADSLCVLSWALVIAELRGETKGVLNSQRGVVGSGLYFIDKDY